MSRVRMGEIAIEVLKEKLEEEGLRLGVGDLRRWLGNVSKRRNIPFEDLVTFAETLIGEMTKEALAPPPDRKQEVLEKNDGVKSGK